MNNRNWTLEPGSRSEGVGYDYYPPETETHLRDYWYIVLKRRWLILTVLVAVVSVATIRALMQKPVYSSATVVHIDRGKINLVQDVMINDYWSGYNEFYPTQARVLRSRDLADRVVRQLRLWEHPYFTGGGAALTPDERTLENLSGAVLGMLRVSQLRNTQLMEIRFNAFEPELSAQLANTLTQQYIEFNSERETNLALNTVGFIREQVEKMQHEIQEKEKLLLQYSKRDDLVMVDEKEVMVMRQLEQINTEVMSARAARAAAEARYQSLSSSAPDSLAEVDSDPSITALVQDQTVLERQIAELASKFKDDWPELKRAREALAEATARLGEERKAVAKRLIAKAEVDYRSALRREQLLSREAEGQKREAQELGRLTTDYNQIKVELDSQRAMLQQLLRRQPETGLSAELGEQTPVNVRIVEAALVPRGPIGTGLSRSVMMGALVGLGLGLALAFFLNYWETTIHTIDDLRRYVPLPYLGMVPRLEGSPQALFAGSPLGKLVEANDREDHRTKKLSTTRSALALSQKSKIASRSKDDVSMISERFKFLRGSLLLSQPGTAPKTVLVTGPDKNAGKTFVACNLATSLADLDKKVLLIDADLRNPQIHKIFRVKNRVGLSNVLSGQTSVEEGCVFTTPIPNLFLLLAGPACPNPAELLGSKKMEATLEACMEHFDYVILDSAPLIPVFDSHYLTVRCDASLLVIRAAHTSRHAVKQSIDLIDRVGGRVTGVVLNDVNLTDPAQSYYYTYHSYEYGTYAEEPVEHTAG